MTLEDQNTVDQALVDEVHKNSQRTAKELALALDVGVDALWVHRALKRLGLTYKIIEHHNKNKYTMENLRHYWRFCTRIHDIPMYLLKYMDESHFSARSK
jgi:NAD(P)H-hydrate repair Nnr-like enzyme with NAD(P)H-hydrate epimerase domain